MKDREFIELLNLYLDHEISPSDAARLEVEIQGSPERRRIYRDYCRMQKACRILAADFSVTPATEALVNDAPRVLPEPRMRPRGARGWKQPLILGAGGLFAAASLAFVAYFDFGSFSGTESRVREASMPAVRTPDRSLPFPMGSTPGLTRNAAAITGNGANSALMPGLANTSDGSLALSFSRSPSLGLRVVSSKEDQLEWVRQFQLVSLAELGERNRVALPRFEAAPMPLRPDVRAIRLGAPNEPIEEDAAFRFVK